MKTRRETIAELEELGFDFQDDVRPDWRDTMADDVLTWALKFMRSEELRLAAESLSGGERS